MLNARLLPDEELFAQLVENTMLTLQTMLNINQKEDTK